MQVLLPKSKPKNKHLTAWHTFAKISPAFPIGGLIQKATQTELSDAVVNAYDAPDPSRASKAAKDLSRGSWTRQSPPQSERTWRHHPYPDGNGGSLAAACKQL